MSATTIVAMRAICDNCTPVGTDKFIGNQRLYARNLDVIQSNAIRRGILATSQMASENLMVIYNKAIDGVEFRWQEMQKAIVQSRSTGGLGKFDCGFDPQALKVKNHLKRQWTERMYIHREECMLTYIGSSFNSDSGGGPRYIADDASLEAAAQNTDLMIDMFMNDARAIAEAVDKTSILGNFTGYDQNGIVNAGISSAPHFDGILKQVSQNANSSFFAAVDVTLPAVGGGAYFVKAYGSWLGSETTIAAVIALINAAVNETGTTQYSSHLASAAVLRITANKEEQEAYGQGAIEIYYSATGTVDNCSDALDATIIENPMSYAEESLLFDYGQNITAANFYDYFKDVIVAWKKHVIRLSEDGRGNVFGNEAPYIACDPLMLVDKEFSQLEEDCSCQNADRKYTFLDSMFPKFNGIKQLEGTGLWFMTYASNIIYLTNQDATQPQMGIWYDNSCQQVRGRLEMLGNVMILDFAAIASNVTNSPFENILTAPYKPEALPHLTPEVRSDGITGLSAYQSRAGAKITSTDLDGGSNFDLRLQDASLLADNLTISSYAWVIYVATGAGAVQPASQVADVTTAFTAAELALVVSVQLTVTFSDSSTDVVIIPKAQFINEVA